jgi:5-methylcytosine-specific restriction endonuclease McrA
VQSLLSHIIPENDLAKVIAYMTKAQIQKMKGKETQPSQSKVNQAATKTEVQKNTQVDGTLEKKSTQSFRAMPKTKRKYISVKVKRAVFARANHCCELIHSDGRRCQSKFQLQTDHVVPLACGGTNDFENLRALCGVHNRSEAERWGLSRPH